jgi:hypothetical protein
VPPKVNASIPSQDLNHLPAQLYNIAEFIKMARLVTSVHPRTLQVLEKVFVAGT